MTQDPYHYATENGFSNTSFKQNDICNETVKFVHDFSFAEEVRFKGTDDGIIVGKVIRETRCYAFVLCGDELKKKKKTSFIPMTTDSSVASGDVSGDEGGSSGILSAEEEKVLATAEKRNGCAENMMPKKRKKDEYAFDATTPDAKKCKIDLDDAQNQEPAGSKMTLRAPPGFENIVPSRAPPGFENIIPFPVELDPSLPSKNFKENNCANVPTAALNESPIISNYFLPKHLLSTVKKTNRKKRPRLHSPTLASISTEKRSRLHSPTFHARFESAVTSNIGGGVWNRKLFMSPDE